MDKILLIGDDPEMSKERRKILSIPITPGQMEDKKVNFSLSLRDALIFKLHQFEVGTESQETKKQAIYAAEMLAQHVTSVEVTNFTLEGLKAKKAQITFGGVDPEMEGTMQTLMSNPAITSALIDLHGFLDDYVQEFERQVGEAAKTRQKPNKTVLTAKGSFPLPAGIVKAHTYTPVGKLQPNVIEENTFTRVALFKMEHILLTLLSKTSKGGAELAESFGGNLGIVETAVSAIGENGQALTGNLYTANTQISIRDIFNEWANGKKLGKTDKSYIIKTLAEYEKELFELVYEQDFGNGQTMLLRCKEPRVQVVRAAVSDSATIEKIKAGDIQTTEKAELLFLRFNAIYLMQKRGYVKTVENLPAILEEAAGGAKSVTDSHYRLYYYFSSLAHNGRTEIYEQELLQKAGFRNGNKWRNDSRDRKKLAQILADIQKTGLILEVEKGKGTKGEKYFFTLAKGGMLDAKRGDA